MPFTQMKARVHGRANAKRHAAQVFSAGTLHGDSVSPQILALVRGHSRRCRGADSVAVVARRIRRCAVQTIGVGDPPRRRADAGKPILRSLLRHAARRARLRRPHRAAPPCRQRIRARRCERGLREALSACAARRHRRSRSFVERHARRMERGPLRRLGEIERRGAAWRISIAPRSRSTSRSPMRLRFAITTSVR